MMQTNCGWIAMALFIQQTRNGSEPAGTGLKSYKRVTASHPCEAVTFY